eukprot:7004479-Pyramimonas_sp.AAC.1
MMSARCCWARDFAAGPQPPKLRAYSRLRPAPARAAAEPKPPSGPPTTSLSSRPKGARPKPRAL